MASSKTLSQVFLDHLADGEQVAAIDAEQLVPRIAQLLEKAREAWPTISIADDVFVAHVAARIGDDEDILPALDKRAAADLYLACACLTGDEEAQTAFVANYEKKLIGALARFAPQGVDIQAVKQQVISYLLLPRGELPPALARYSGSGSLGGYLRVSVMNEGVRMAKQLQREKPGISDFSAPVDLVDDPELQGLKEQYRGQFKEAFQAAMAMLDKDDLVLLRYHYHSGLGVREIAALQGVSKSAVGRSLAALREFLGEKTREQLMKRIGVGHTMAASIIRMINSQLDVSLSKYMHSRKS